MDCERFDQHVIDALYDELDEVTYAALKRHVEGCGRCAGVWASLRATREVGVLPIVEPPDDLESRILLAVDRAERRAPWHRTVLRGLAWAGSHAMRPQLAMAALFFLVIGSSLLLLRPHGSQSRPTVAVTERGTPAGDMESEAKVAAAAAPASPPPIAAASAPAATAAAPAEAPAAAIGGKDGRGGDDARAALADARAVRDASGCAAAVPKLDAVAVTFSGSQAAADALWDEGQCYKQMGETSKAQQIFLALRSTGYRDRADGELAAAAATAMPQQNVASRAAAKPAAVLDEAGGSASPKHAAPRPAGGGGINPRAPAGPKRDATGF